MNVNTAAEVLYYTGVPTTDQTGEKITIGGLIRNVMNAPIEEPWTPETLLRCGDLARRASSFDEADYNDEERAFIKERAAIVYKTGPNAPLFYSALHIALSDPQPLAVTVASEAVDPEAAAV